MLDRVTSDQVTKMADCDLCNNSRQRRFCQRRPASLSGDAGRLTLHSSGRRGPVGEWLQISVITAGDAFDDDADGIVRVQRFFVRSEDAEV